MDLFLTLLVMFLCLVMEAFFSGSEIGVVSADRMRLRHEAAKGSRGAKLALRMLKRPEWLLSTTLVGTNIAVVTNTTMATALMIHLFGEAGSWLAIVLVAPLIWVFGEIVPKSVFQQRADTITPRVIFLLKGASYVFYPILVVFTALTRGITTLLGDKDKKKNPFTLREEILTMLQMSTAGGDIEPMEKTMIRRLFDFGDTTAREVMIPLIDVAAIERTSPVRKATQVALETAHKRLPVYHQRVDRIVGVLNTLKLLGLDAEQPVAPYVRPVQYIPGSKSIKELLFEMRAHGDLLVVVVDEFGGAEGIVTIEDIMEEVVEDLQDEFDTQEQPREWVRKLGDKDWLVSARIDLDDLKDELGIDLPEGKYETLAGFLLEKAREVPAPGTTIQYKDTRFTIEKATAQSIQEVRIQW